ncbi:hypothetical protein SDC9_110639 [bioreactor metagenome]|uniref:Uncharacterized protein n=1 Tax=bioreactor metagenome TaxID=1076179 RepID=A0A645BF68_9ZZZZ
MGCLPGGSGKVLIAPAAVSSPGQYKGLFIRHIFDNFICGSVPYDGAAGDFKDERFSVFSAGAFAGAIGSVFGRVFTLISEIHKSGHVVVDRENHVAAPAAVTAVRAAGRHIFFPMEGNGAVAARPRFHRDVSRVDKVGH